MKKLLYVLLGAAGAILVKTLIDRRRRALLEGALPRPVPSEFDGEVSIEDEIAGPLTEV